MLKVHALYMKMDHTCEAQFLQLNLQNGPHKSDTRHKSDTNHF